MVSLFFIYLLPSPIALNSISSSRTSELRLSWILQPYLASDFCTTSIVIPNIVVSSHFDFSFPPCHCTHVPLSSFPRRGTHLGHTHPPSRDKLLPMPACTFIFGSQVRRGKTGQSLSRTCSTGTFSVFTLAFLQWNLVRLAHLVIIPTHIHSTTFCLAIIHEPP